MSASHERPYLTEWNRFCVCVCVCVMVRHYFLFLPSCKKTLPTWMEGQASLTRHNYSISCPLKRNGSKPNLVGNLKRRIEQRISSCRTKSPAAADFGGERPRWASWLLTSVDDAIRWREPLNYPLKLINTGALIDDDPSDRWHVSWVTGMVVVIGFRIMNDHRGPPSRIGQGLACRKRTTATLDATHLTLSSIEHRSQTAAVVSPL